MIYEQRNLGNERVNTIRITLETTPLPGASMRE